ncbi:MAG: galactokinase, partial [Bdellovibrionales bacterium]|nr:galactokinase [Bdellovibrionales bacterium]
MRVEIESPTRVDLAGGTIDCWPLYNFIGPCWTINLSISVYTGVKLNLRDDKKITVLIKDLNYHKLFESLEDLYICFDEELDLLKAHLKYWNPQKGLDIETYSQSPVGGGLGGSSSLTVSLLKAFAKIFNKTWTLEELVRVSHNLEAQLLHTPTGTQDYFPAAQKGLNLISYSPEGFKSEVIPYDVQYFAQRMLVVYSGRSHHSGINNWQVLKLAVEKDLKTLNALSEVADIAKDLHHICLAADWEH